MATTSQLNQILAECKAILAQCIVSANQAAEAAASIGTAGLAPLDSPAFIGSPTAPTPDAGDISTRLATTAWIGAKLAQPNGIATLDPTGLVPVTQLPFSGLTFKGSWDASANSPHLVSGSGTAGNFYVVSVAGTTTLNGISTWNVGDQALFSGSAWSRIPYTAPPISNLPLSSLAGISQNTFVGSTMAGTAAPQAIPITQLLSILPRATGDSGAGGSVGLVPPPPPGSAGSGAFLAADMTYKVPAAPNLSAYALLNSPAFTGTATVATQARNNQSSAIASTQFVVNQQAQASEVAQLKVDGTASCGTSTYAAKIDHIHPTDTSRAAAASPQMSGNGAYNGTLTLTGTMSVIGLMNIIGALGGTVVAESNLKLSAGTVGNAIVGRHGFLPALSGNATDVLTGTGGFVTGVTAIASPVQMLTATGSVTILGTRCFVVLQGAGGAGATAQAVGGAGATLFKLLTGLTVGQTLSLTCPAGITNGNGGAAVLSSGSQSITTLTAGGGLSNGGGGSATNGDVNVVGQSAIISGGSNNVIKGGDSLFGSGDFIDVGSSNESIPRGFGGGGTSVNLSGGAMALLFWYP